MADWNLLGEEEVVDCCCSCCGEELCKEVAYLYPVQYYPWNQGILRLESKLAWDLVIGCLIQIKWLAGIITVEESGQIGPNWKANYHWLSKSLIYTFSPIFELLAFDPLLDQELVCSCCWVFGWNHTSSHHQTLLFRIKLIWNSNKISLSKMSHVTCYVSKGKMSQSHSSPQMMNFGRIVTISLCLEPNSSVWDALFHLFKLIKL